MVLFAIPLERAANLKSERRVFLFLSIGVYAKKVPQEAGRW